MLSFMTSRELYDFCSAQSNIEKDQVEYVEMQGWVRTNRHSKAVGFIELNDGTYFRSVQIVYGDNLANFDEVCKYLTGTAIKVTGVFKLTPDSKQPFELEAKEIVLEGACDNSYPLQKKRHSFEYLR